MRAGFPGDCKSLLITQELCITAHGLEFFHYAEGFASL